MGHRVMIVEDESIIALEMEAKLKNMNYIVCGKARNSEAAIKMAAEIHPDIILMDINLGSGKNGIYTAGKIREMLDVPIVYLTAYADENTIRLAKETGPFGYLTKPIRESDLNSTIEMALEKHREALNLNRKFYWIAENAGEGYIFLDKNDKIKYANNKAKMYFDLNNADFSDSAFLEIIKKRYDLRPEESWRNWPDISEENSTLYLIRPETAKENSLWLELNVLFPDASSDYRILHIKDITGDISLNSSSRTVYSMVSHKLRTPMNHLINSLSFLAAMNLSDEELREFSNMARNSSVRLQETVQDIIRYGHAPYAKFSAFSLANISSQAQKIAAELEITDFECITSENAQNADILFSKDAAEIVLFEIFENAKKFHEKHSPSLRMEVELNETAVIRIRNDGPHLSPEILNNAWQPFFQGEKYATGEMKGTGLGLPTVASLVWSSGGNCKIYNSPDQSGVTVEISLLPISK